MYPIVVDNSPGPHPFFKLVADRSAYPMLLVYFSLCASHALSCVLVLRMGILFLILSLFCGTPVRIRMMWRKSRYRFGFPVRAGVARMPFVTRIAAFYVCKFSFLELSLPISLILSMKYLAPPKLSRCVPSGRIYPIIQSLFGDVLAFGNAVVYKTSRILRTLC